MNINNNIFNDNFKNYDINIMNDIINNKNKKLDNMTTMEKKFNPFDYSLKYHFNMIIFIFTYLYNKFYNINKD